MTWTPQAQVLDLTPIAGNLLAFIEENDADALAWADTEDEFAATYTNASGRLQTKFPSLMVLTQECEVDLGDRLIGEFNLVLEGTVSGGNPDDLVLKTKKYAKAVESMAANISTAELTDGTSPAISHAALIKSQTVYDILRGQQTPSAFLQIFQTRFTWQLIAEAY